MRYIGSKQLLVNEIKLLLEKHTDGTEKTFLDLFAGTNVVGQFFKRYYTVISNDLLYFNYVNAKATIENNGNLAFTNLKKLGIDNPLTYLNNIKIDINKIPKSAYYTKSYSPIGDAMYFTPSNALKIDKIRKQIEVWNKANLLEESEYFYLLSCLISAIPFISNITGTYGAYLKHWDKRALKDLLLQPLEVINNNASNKAFNEDANELVKKIKADIVYIDTPYNNRQYASNYHVLENIARNTKPVLNGKTRIFNWASLKSNYSVKNKAFIAFDELLNNIEATHIIVSYNTEGIIPESDLIELLKKHSINNKIDIKRISYRKYKSKKISKKTDLEELLLYIQKKPLNTISKDIVLEKNTTKWSIKSEEFIKSPLNYIGGKYKLLKQILPLFPPKINTFVDLFSGGCNVGINVPANKHIFNDMNHLINDLFRYFLTQNTEDLIQKIKFRIKEYNLSKTNEAAYLAFRDMYNNNPNPLDLYILSSFSYNYQFRFNNQKKYNNPFGRNRSHFSSNMENNLRRFVTRLRELDVSITDKYFTEFNISKFSKKDFFYFDPPYLITTGNYNDGNRGFQNWTEAQELELLKLMDTLTSHGIKYALSNVLEHKGKCNNILKDYISKTPVNVHYLNSNYNNASYNNKKGDSIEVLITNY